MLTTDYIVLETWRLLHIKTGWKSAEFFWKSIRLGIATIENVSPVDLERAWSIGTEFPDQEFSLTDRTSFAVMQRLGVYSVASFDNDFAIYRFGAEKRQAFEVLR